MAVASGPFSAAVLCRWILADLDAGALEAAEESARRLRVAIARARRQAWDRKAAGR